MPTVTNANKVISFPFRPVGFKPAKGKQATFAEIKSWRENEDPGFIQSQSYLTLGGFLAAALGVIISLIGIIIKSNIGKLFGGLLTLIGLGSGGVGYFNKLDLEFDKKQFLEELREISKADKSKQPDLRKALMQKYKDDVRSIRSLLSYHLPHDIDTGSAEQAKTLISEMNEEIYLDAFNTRIEKIKNKSLDGELRAQAIDGLYTFEYSSLTVPLLKELLNDKTEYFPVRSNSIIELRKISKGNTTEQDKLAKQLIAIINDKTDDSSVRTTAVRILSIMKKHEAIDTLVPILRDRNDSRDVRSEVIAEFSHIGDERTIEVLEASARHEEVFDDRYRAEMALAKVKERVYGKSK